MVNNTDAKLLPISASAYRWMPELFRLVLLGYPITGSQAENRGTEDQDRASHWFGDLVDLLCNLPWDGHEWSSENPRPQNMGAVVELTRILFDLMPHRAVAPQVTPTWVGGAMATWELGDVCLEIEAAPTQPVQYSYVDERDGRDFGEEGDVAGNEGSLKRWLHNIADTPASLKE